jgi:uncharacterized phage-associated protein
MNSSTPSLDKKKLEQVILYFLEKINNIHLGRVKLMKLLYYVDFDHYERHGRSITHAKYRKLPHGPVPDKAEKVVEQMIKAGAVKPVDVLYGDFTQNRLLTENGKFDASLFTGDEIQTLEKVALRWEEASAKQIESATHKEAPWATTEDLKAIDYELAEYRTPLGEEEEDGWIKNSPVLARLVEELV